MNKILFDITKYGLTLNDFTFLVQDILKESVAVNGCTIRWCYNVNKDGVVELTASFREV